MQNTTLIRRIAAMLYDTLLVFACLVMLAIISTAYLGGKSVYEGGDVYFAIYNAIRFSIIFFFFVLYWSRSGRTLGMQSWRLQLETADGGHPTIGRATLRFFASLLSWLPAGLGFLWSLWDKDKLAWHDRLSGTRIVYYPKDEANKDES
jgi:uncharacterized RDD family membrane protein YckC